GGLPATWRAAARRGAAVSPGSSPHRRDRPGRRPARGAAAECRADADADPAGPLAGAEGRGLVAPGSPRPRLIQHHRGRAGHGATGCAGDGCRLPSGRRPATPVTTDAAKRDRVATARGAQSIMADGIKVSSGTRREFVRKVSASAAAAGAILGGMGFDRLFDAAMAAEMGRSEKPLKAAFSNAGLQATWCAQGKQGAEY